MLTVDSNADEVAAGLTPAIVDGAQQRADVAAAGYALSVVRPKTPRQTGALAAGLRSVAVPEGGFALTAPQPYGPTVEARTGFASSTLQAAAPDVVAIYDRELQATFDTT